MWWVLFIIAIVAIFIYIYRKKEYNHSNSYSKSKIIESVSNDKSTLKDREETEEFLQHFRQTFTLDFQSNQKVSMDEDITTISIDRYEQPEVTSDVQKRIDRIQSITNSIEQNLVQTASKKGNVKKFKIDYKKSLNEMQYIAATTIAGPLLVIAGAGTGKTRTIVYRVAFLLENGHTTGHLA